MDGLECSELLFSGVKQASKSMRCDAEYFSKTALLTEAFILKREHFFFNAKSVVSGPFGSTLTSSSYLEKGDIPFIRIEDIKGGFHINEDGLVYISNADNQRISNSQLYADDLILSKVGNSIGFFARVNDNIKTCNISENNIGIKLASYKLPEKRTILAYLNSKYGQILLLRRKSGNAQPKLNVDDVCFIPIPKFGDYFSQAISALIMASDGKMQKSRIAYKLSTESLSEQLGFNRIKLNPDAVSIKNLSAFHKSGRLDAEYYLPKYDDLFSLLDGLPAKRLGEIVDIRKSIEPGSEYYGDEGVPFIRVSDVTKMGIDAPSIKIPLKTAPSIEKLYPKKDTILLSKDGSVGIAYKMEDDIDAVTSGALLHLRVKNTTEVMPDYLTLVLNSEVVQLQAERDTNGAIIQHWKLGDIANVIVPILPYEVQSEIARKVQESFSLRRQSEKLIETAVKAVEIAIERDEAAALEWMNEMNAFITGRDKYESV